MCFLLDPKLGGIILGLSWSLNAVSGMTVATAAVRRFGFKYAMIISLWGYTFQIASLYFAIILPKIAWPIAIIGSVISGFTSAIWWTAQGVYFEKCCVEIEKVLCPGETKDTVIVDTVRANLSAHWTIIYQVSDIVVFLSLSLIPLIGGVAISSVILGLTFLGAVTALLGFTFDSLGSSASGEMSWEEVTDAIVAVPKQMSRDSRVALLAPFVFGFGISTAMFAYFVNSSVVSDSSGLGTLSLGFLEAFSYFVAVMSAYPYAYVSNAFPKGQDYVIQFGSTAFLLSGAVVWGLTTRQLGTWTNILIAKGLYGLGRGVFEGSCRAVYAGMFTGADLSPAFSAQTLSVGFSGGLCFFLFSVLSKNSIAGVTVVNGLVALCTYSVLMYAVDARVPLPWGSLMGVCCCRSGGGTRTVEGTAEGVVDKYTTASRRAGRTEAAKRNSSLGASLLQHSTLGEYSLEQGDSRASEDDLFVVANVMHHKLQHTPTNSTDNCRPNNR